MGYGLNKIEFLFLHSLTSFNSV